MRLPLADREMRNSVVSKAVKFRSTPQHRLFGCGHHRYTRERSIMPDKGQFQKAPIPWAIQMKATSAEEPSRLVQLLAGAILGCGGWVLSRGVNDFGLITMLFEFERQSCVDIYGVLVAVGLELSQEGHVRFTELCQCTRNRDCSVEIASVDLEIQTRPCEMQSALRTSGAI